MKKFKVTVYKHGIYWPDTPTKGQDYTTSDGVNGRILTKDWTDPVSTLWLEVTANEKGEADELVREWLRRQFVEFDIVDVEEIEE